MSEPKHPDIQAIVGSIRTLAATFAPLVALADLAEWLSAQETAIGQYTKRLETLREAITAAERERDERKEMGARAQAQQHTELRILKEQCEQIRIGKETWLHTHEQRLDAVKDEIRVEKEKLAGCLRETHAAETELERVRAEIADTLKGAAL